MDILKLILLLSTIVILFLATIVVIIVYYKPRRRTEIREPPPRQAPIAVEPRAPRRSPIPSEREETMIFTETAPGEEVSETVRTNLLQILSRYQAIPVEDVEARIRASKEEILKALRELEEKNLIRIDGGVLVLSERGEKLLTKLREKYAEKSKWYELLE